MSPITVAAFLCALTYLVLTPRPASLARSTVKTASVALLAGAAALADAPVYLTLALALCALGDWLLSRETEPTFMAGIGAFAAGHIAYITLFLTRPEADPARIVTAWGLWIALALVALGGVMAVFLAPRAGALKGPVLAYIPIIVGMGIAALTVPGDGTLAFVLPAAIVFIVSDSILACDKFLLPDGHPARQLTPFAVWATYWTAQAGFFAAFT